MSRVYDAMRRASERRERGNSPESSVRGPGEASEADAVLPWPESHLAGSPPPTAASTPAPEVDAETRERLDALQVSLSALEDRLDDDDAWPDRSDSTTPRHSSSGTPLQRIDWIERVAQLEVTVHALEDRLEEPERPATSGPAHDAVDQRTAALETDRIVRRLELHLETLRARVDRANLRHNLLLGGLAALFLSIYAC